MTAFLELQTKIESAWRERTNAANETLHSSLEVLKTRTELNLEASAAVQLRREDGSLREQHQTLVSEIERKRNLLAWNEIHNLLNQRDKIFTKLMELEDQRSKEWSERRKQIAAKDQALAGQLSELQDLHRSQTTELEILEAQLFYLHDAVRPAARILPIRFWWEMLFPIVFGAAATLFGFLRSG